MTINITPIGAIVSLAISIATLWGIIVKPFKDAIKENAAAMNSLKETVNSLNTDLMMAKNDRMEIRKILDRHDGKIEKNCEDIARHDEKINALFKRAN